MLVRTTLSGNDSQTIRLLIMKQELAIHLSKLDKARPRQLFFNWQDWILNESKNRYETSDPSIIIYQQFAIILYTQSDSNRYLCAEHFYFFVFCPAFWIYTRQLCYFINAQAINFSNVYCQVGDFFGAQTAMRNF